MFLQTLAPAGMTAYERPNLLAYYEMCLGTVNKKADYSNFLKTIYYYSLKRSRKTPKVSLEIQLTPFQQEVLKSGSPFSWRTGSWRKICNLFFIGFLQVFYMKPCFLLFCVQNMNKLHTFAITQGKGSEDTP